MRTRRIKFAVVATSITVVLVFVTLLLWYGQRMSEAILPGAGAARTTSMEPIDLILRDAEDGAELRLRVPKAYLTKAENWRGGSQRFIRIETRLPALQPGPAVTPPPRPASPEYAAWLKESNEGIYIALENNYADRSDAVARDWWLKTYSADRHDKRPVAYESIGGGGQFGLSGYRSLACTPQEPASVEPAANQDWQCSDSYREYYISKGEFPAVLVFCNLAGATGIWLERQGCQASATFHGFSLLYIFRYSQLSRWQEFDSAVRKLLESFVVPQTQR